MNGVVSCLFNCVLQPYFPKYIVKYIKEKGCVFMGRVGGGGDIKKRNVKVPSESAVREVRMLTAAAVLFFS